ncbi:hypothetical protein EYF80_034012 [Liparis tanakae]|uniref:Uncharacterized protein n=1 Tax=Liparis tanakae TaxID=230148 RepID=A0A4Z2GT30_9TELE|nr:hypothetical protein EYF80_034012 [Liparis tanakae]
MNRCGDGVVVKDGLAGFNSTAHKQNAVCGSPRGPYCKSLIPATAEATTLPLDPWFKRHTPKPLIVIAALLYCRPFTRTDYRRAHACKWTRAADLHVTGRSPDSQTLTPQGMGSVTCAYTPLNTLTDNPK